MRPKATPAAIMLRYGVGFLIVTFSGCQREHKWHLVTIEGNVTRAGRAVAGVQVVFWPDVEAGTQGPRAAGVTNGDGHYKLQTDAGVLGAVPGNYHVCIVMPRNEVVDDEAVRKSRRASRRGQGGNQIARATANADKSLEAGAAGFAKKYGQFDKTPLRAEVLPGRQTIDFIIP